MLQVLLFILSFSAWSADYSAQAGKSYVQADTCKEVSKEIAAIKKWSGSKLPDPACKCKASVCEADVRALLPEKIRSIMDMDLKHGGPNCWNSVMFYHKIVPDLFTSGPEIRFWLDSPLCQEIPASEKRPGDVINVTDFWGPQNRFIESHSMIYLSDELSFTKNGPPRDIQYALRSTYYTQDAYYVPEDCMGVSQVEGKAKRCPYISTFYRCQNLDTYLSDADYSTETKQILQALTLNAKIMREHLFKDSSLKEFNRSEISKIEKLAAGKLGLPGYDELSPTIQTIVDDLAIKTRFTTQEMYNSEKLQEEAKLKEKAELVKYTYLRSISPVKSSEGGKKMGELLKYFKALSAERTHDLNDKERLIWAQIYFTAFGLLEQYRYISP